MGTITREISDVKRARDEAERAKRLLEKTKEEIATLVEQAPDGIFVADLDGNYTNVNGSGCRMLGYAREEIIGKNVTDLIPSDRVDQLAREKEQLLEGRTVVSEWLLRRRDGSLLPVEVSASILADGRWQGFVRDISVRKHLEEALRASHADLERAQSVAKVGSWRLDVRRNELTWSEELYRIFGVAPGTPMTYEAFLACVHPDDRAYVDREWTAALRGAPYDIEHRVVSNGSVKWVREKADLAFDDGHALIGGIGVTLDITDRKQDEERLRLAEAKSSGIVSISADAIISIDEQQRITLFNEGAQKIFGYTAAEAIGAPLEMLIPERYRGRHREHVERFASGPATSRRMGDHGITIFGLRKSGEEFPADAAISKLDVAGGRILTVALRDITEQRRLEEEPRFLSEAGAVLASTLDFEATVASIGRLATRSFADACLIYLVTEGGPQRLEAITREPLQGWIRDTVLRTPLDRSRAPDIWSELDADRSVLVPRVTPQALEGFAQSADHLRAIRALDPRSLIISPLFAHGKLLGAMALVSFAPSRAYGPADVRFAEQVAQRAAYAIDNAELYAAARTAIRSRDDVLAVVAHDLRNPLGAILMNAALMRRAEGEPDRRSRKPADAIERSARRMNRLIQDLLDVARLEEGRLPVEPSPLSVRKIACESLEAHEPVAAAAHVQLRLEIADDLPDVWADHDRLLQVFENLIGNAIKFTGGGGMITVGARSIGDEILLWVTDTGAGIGVEDLPHVFDRFWQAKAAEGRGAGLGLPIAKGIVEAHRGRMWVESTRGRGTTFFFTLPAVARAARPARPMTDTA
jgi:PAS domain S-box-containing protein